jgi:hypothetical protein
MGMVTLNQKDQLRSHVLQHLDNGSYAIDEAAQLLQVTPRRAWRLLAAYRQHGVRSIPHGNRGRRPRHAMDPRLAAQALELLGQELAGCNNAHAAELLSDRGLQAAVTQEGAVGLGPRASGDGEDAGHECTSYRRDDGQRHGRC